MSGSSPSAEKVTLKKLGRSQTQRKGSFTIFLVKAVNGFQFHFNKHVHIAVEYSQSMKLWYAYYRDANNINLYLHTQQMKVKDLTPEKAVRKLLHMKVIKGKNEWVSFYQYYKVVEIEFGDGRNAVNPTFCRFSSPPSVKAPKARFWQAGEATNGKLMTDYKETPYQYRFDGMDPVDIEANDRYATPQERSIPKDVHVVGKFNQVPLVEAGPEKKDYEPDLNLSLHFLNTRPASQTTVEPIKPRKFKPFQKIGRK